MILDLKIASHCQKYLQISERIYRPGERKFPSNNIKQGIPSSDYGEFPGASSPILSDVCLVFRREHGKLVPGAGAAEKILFCFRGPDTSHLLSKYSHVVLF